MRLVYCLITAFSLPLIANASMSSDETSDDLIAHKDMLVRDLTKRHPTISSRLNEPNWEIKPTNTNTSLAIIREDHCSIHINRSPSPDNTLLSNRKMDLDFTIAHELAHCIFGIGPIKYGIKWKISSISPIKKVEFDKLIASDFKDKVKGTTYTYMFKTNTQNPPLLSSFHEMFADVFATIIIKSLHNDDILDELLQAREKSFNSGLGFFHPTHFALHHLKKSGMLKNAGLLSIDEIIYFSEKVAQFGLVSYILNSNEEYQ